MPRTKDHHVTFLCFSTAKLLFAMGMVQIAWGLFFGSIRLILLAAPKSSPIIYGESKFENYYHSYLETYVYFITGGLFVVAVKLVRNASAVIAVVIGCSLTLFQLAMKILYAHNFYRNPHKYNVCGKYHLFGEINYKDRTKMFPITREELIAEQVILTMRITVEVVMVVILLFVSTLHTRFILIRFCGVNTIDPSQHKERRASYQPPPTPIQVPEDYVELEDIM